MLWSKLDDMCYRVDEAQDFFISVVEEFNKEEVEKIIATTWALWRNMAIWEGNQVTPAQTIHNGAWSITEWKQV